jgi:hypothetical protein
MLLRFRILAPLQRTLAFIDPPDPPRRVSDKARPFKNKSYSIAQKAYTYRHFDRLRQPIAPRAIR